MNDGSSCNFGHFTVQYKSVQLGGPLMIVTSNSVKIIVLHLVAVKLRRFPLEFVRHDSSGCSPSRV